MSWPRVFALASIPLCCATVFPDIKPVAQRFHVSQPANLRLETVIQATSGRDAYKVICRDGDQEDSDFAYSGLMQCRMVDLSGASPGPDLLAQPGATRDWLSRGRFLYDELTGNCRADPEWGTRRTFSLRKMRLVVGIEGLEEARDLEGDGKLSYTLTIRADPDAQAVHENDARVPIPDGDGRSDCTRKREWWIKAN